MGSHPSARKESNSALAPTVHGEFNSLVAQERPDLKDKSLGIGSPLSVQDPYPFRLGRGIPAAHGKALLRLGTHL